MAHLLCTLLRALCCTTELIYVNAPHSLDSELPEDDSSSTSSGSNSSRSPVRRRSLTAAAGSAPDLQVVYGEASGNTVNSTTAADAQQYEAWPADKDKAANTVNAATTATAAAGTAAGATAGTSAGTTAGAAGSTAADDQRCWW
jgi:hypothetical protein